MSKRLSLRAVALMITIVVVLVGILFWQFTGGSSAKQQNAMDAARKAMVPQPPGVQPRQGGQLGR